MSVSHTTLGLDSFRTFPGTAPSVYCVGVRYVIIVQVVNCFDCLSSDLYKCVCVWFQVFRSTGVELGTDLIHLSNSFDNFKHHQGLARQQHDLQKELVAVKSTANLNMDNITKTQSTVTQLEQLSVEAKNVLSNKIEELQSQVEVLRRRFGRAAEPQSVDNALAARVKQLEVQDANNQQIVKNQRKEIADLKSELQAFRREYHQQQQQRAGHGGHVPRHTSVSGRETQGKCIARLLSFFFFFLQIVLQ